MSQAAADRNLLFGVLALQMDFITREQLIAAMQAWVFDKQKSLGQLLVDQKVLPEDNRMLLDALMVKHLAKHNNDPEKSLAAVSSVTEVKKDLAKIADGDVQASLVHVGAARPSKPADIYATVAPSGSTIPAGASRFRILRPHARGGLGEVFVARDEELHREVALKEIQERQADNEESRARFVMEAEITGGLEHPGIVPVYGLGTYGDGRPYYAMRFIRGDSLKEAADRYHRSEAAATPGQRNLELRALLGRFVDVCDAIAYAHSRGVLHRDLKPGNIMLGKYGETLVVDWGLAKALGSPAEAATTRTEPGEGSLIPHSISSSSQTLMGSAMGTPQYMSPEQAAGQLDKLGPASDVYSLGATLYYVLTGQPSIVEKDVGVILQKVQRGDIPKPSSITETPAALEAICLKAMALRPADRYATPLGLAEDIEHWLADEPVSALPEPWTAKVRRWAGRHRVLVTSAAAAVAVALVGFIVATILLTAANERERLAKEKASENYQLARGAVNRYLTEVSNNDLLREPGMEPLRKKLLESAREYNQKFVEQRKNDPAAKAWLAMATFRLGQITGELDSELDAIKLDEEAVTLFESLPPGQSTVETRSDLASCYRHLGQLYRLTDQIKKSDESYKKSLILWESLVKEGDKNARFQDGLARARLGMGSLQQYTSRRDDAQKSYQQAIAIWEKLHAADPKALPYRRQLGIAHNNLGMIYKRLDGKGDDAKTELVAARDLQKQIVEEEPNIGQYQIDLAKTMYNLGEYDKAAKHWLDLVDRHPAVAEPHMTLADAYLVLVPVQLSADPKKAEEFALKGVAMLRQLADRHPGVPNYQAFLGRGLSSLGEYYLDAKVRLPEKAEAAFKEAVRIQEKLGRDSPELPAYQRDLARSYTGLGNSHGQKKQFDQADADFKKALAVWEKLIADHGRELDYTTGKAAACLTIGDLAHARNSDKEAVVWFNRAMESAPDSMKGDIEKRLEKLQAK